MCESDSVGRPKTEKSIRFCCVYLFSLYICAMRVRHAGRLKRYMDCTLNVKGRLLSLEKPLVMGILNVTDDSFYEGSRVHGARFVERAKDMLACGAAILDVGACSTRPGSEPVSQEVELARLHEALSLLDKELPGAVVSVDTFRGAVARECVQEHNVAIINDVSAFDWDEDMLRAVIELNVPYVLTHSSACRDLAADDFLPTVLKQLASKMWLLRQSGVKDIIVDPGFGFGKSVEQNYIMLDRLAEFALLDAPLLAGMSRKSMITKVLGVPATEALPGTVALGMAALMGGAKILRVHDVKEAVDSVRLFMAMKGKC